MKHFLKYILIFLCLVYNTHYGYAQKNRKKANTTVHKKKSSSPKKTLKKATTKKKNKKGRAQKQNLPSSIPLSSINPPKELLSVKLDTVPEKEVSIISAFKPQLKNIAKISFTQSLLKKDTSSVALNYQLPTSNLSFQYKPISLIPRSFKEKDVQAPLSKTNFKVGFGNYSQQLFDLSYHTEDLKKNNHFVNANFESSNGMYYLQQYQNKYISYIGDINIDTQHSLQIQAYYKNSNRYRFGLVPDSRSLLLSSYQQPFSLLGISIQWVNNNESKPYTLWRPLVKIENFKGVASSTNMNLEMINPISFTLKSGGKFNFDMYYNYNTYNSSSTTNFKNTLFTVQPSIELDKWNAAIKVGVQPTFTTEKFSLYPLIQFSKKLNDTNYTLEAHWQTLLTNNNYAGLAMINPWIAAPSVLKITTQEKKSLDLFINASKKLQYSLGLSLNDYRNIPFFNRINNVNASSFWGLQYQPIFEYRAITLEFLAQLNYQWSDQFYIKSKAKYIQFNSIKENTNAWGILPLQLSSNAQWLVSKKWSLNGEVEYWSGASFTNNLDKTYTLTNALVVNASLDYLLTNHLRAWAKAENLLDKKYQRWAEYPSLGVQLMAGIVYSFHK